MPIAKKCICLSTKSFLTPATFGKFLFGKKLCGSFHWAGMSSTPQACEENVHIRPIAMQRLRCVTSVLWYKFAEASVQLDAVMFGTLAQIYYARDHFKFYTTVRVISRRRDRCVSHDMFARCMHQVDKSTAPPNPECKFCFVNLAMPLIDLFECFFLNLQRVQIYRTHGKKRPGSL